MHNDNKYIRMTIDALRGEGLPKIEFNMAHVFYDRGHGCGSSACIAGHIAALYDDEHGTRHAPVYHLMPMNVAFCEIAKLADMTYNEGRRLFYPEELLGHFEYIEADEAADVLEHYALTGVVDWSNVVDRLVNR